MPTWETRFYSIRDTVLLAFFMYGGFITFVLPVSKHFGFNIDFAVTNKTGFNVGMGINATIPIK